MRFFKCFSAPKENKPSKKELPIYNSFKDTLTIIKNKEVKDEFDKQYLYENKEHIFKKFKFEKELKNIFFNRLCIIIDYSLTNADIMLNVDQMIFNLSSKLKYGMIPLYFQINKNIDKKEKLRDVIFNKMHIDNILLIDKLIN